MRADDAEANLAALDDILAEFAESDDVENLTLVDDPGGLSCLGLYDAQLLDLHLRQ